MPLVRRRARAAEESDAESPTTQRRRVSPSSDAEDEDVDATQGENNQTSQMANKLVRLAFSNEHSRTPTRRTDISAKVLGSQGRQFKAVFSQAQELLRSKYAVELTPLPSKEKVTLRDRRAAAKAEKTNAPTNAWVLTTCLPEKYRKPDIIGPAKAPTFEQEASYTGLYSFVITCIILNGGSISESKLDRYLKRMNIDISTPVGPTDKVLSQMIKHSYIVRTTDTSGGEENIDYTVGPRGKVEVGEQGAAGLVRTVYGEDAPDDLDRKLDRSLRLAHSRIRTQQQSQDEATAQNGTGRGWGRPRRHGQDGESE
ncbi:MAGE family-domain-containing protein [Phyllosticta citribraziliensis]|uniref:MAGE family-domain-containing protein n=1 Tax=Phyllosticta citribraziliensis TaxID=989973 RepID=A0ABR1LB23_9PEZI